MTKEEAKYLLLQSSLYKTVAWAGIIWIPATKLANCSPNWDLKMVLGAMIDWNAAIVILVAVVLFILAGSSRKKAVTFLNQNSED